MDDEVDEVDEVVLGRLVTGFFDLVFVFVFVPSSSPSFPESYDVVTVSYTHLTLPTKRIV